MNWGKPRVDMENGGVWETRNGEDYQKEETSRKDILIFLSILLFNCFLHYYLILLMLRDVLTSIISFDWTLFSNNNSLGPFDYCLVETDEFSRGFRRQSPNSRPSEREIQMRLAEGIEGPSVSRSASSLAIRFREDLETVFMDEESGSLLKRTSHMSRNDCAKPV